MFSLTPGKFASRDAHDKIKHIEHIHEPYLSISLAEPTPEQLADEYVSAVASAYQLDAGLIRNLSAAIVGEPTRDEAQLHRTDIKEIAGSIVVDYAQSYRGVPVWGADFSVHIAPSPSRVTSSTSTLHDSIKLGNDLKKVASEYKDKLTPESINRLLGMKKEEGISKINGMRLIIYQFDPSQRTEFGEEEPQKDVSFEQGPPSLPLPPVPEKFKAGTHYAVVEVLFDLALPGWKDLHWRALIEPTSGSVLYLRPLVSFVTGRIFRIDPISLSGDPAMIPSAPEASLSSWRTSVPLTDLTTANPQDLDGAQVQLQEIEPPAQAGPTASSPFDFSYAVKTADFAAVNAYYHVNWFFNLIKGMGFNLTNYFDHTIFPVPVDHWSLGLNVNAHCPGNIAGNGIGHFCFGVAQGGQAVGIANDVRVVIHEFGHALLWDHVNSPNFGFAHSAGDGLAAILMDPESRAPDRFLSFPWPQPTMDRHHDRKVSDGWGWFGSQYNTQYRGEQVLSTTLFRLYQSAGGDSPHASDRAWASRYVAYLVIKAIGMLTTTTANPEVFVTALMNADLTTANFEGHPGGALHKAIRWAFEKQGLYQPLAKPGLPRPPFVTEEGNPPDVDVYIDDSRHGEYQYLYAFWESEDLWVRRSPDGGTTHQEPFVGKPGYMYVRVKNRGMQAANEVVVKAFHCSPGTGLAWPDHWSPMDTKQLAAPGPIPSGGEAVVGPFKWTPEVGGHECLLAIASASGDPANDTTVAGPIPHSRFVPFDNNIGQRNIHPVYAISMVTLVKYFKKMTFTVINPFNKTVEVELMPVLPAFLEKQGYGVGFQNPGENKFNIGPYASKKAIFSIEKKPMAEIPPQRVALPKRPKPGIVETKDMIEDDGEFAFEEFAARRLPIKFRIVTLMDGQNMGGVTYLLSPVLEDLPIPGPKASPPQELAAEIDLIRETLSGQPGIKGVRVRKVILEVELDN